MPKTINKEEIKENEIVKTEIKEDVETNTNKPVKEESKQEPLKRPSNDELIRCRSVVIGDLIYISKKTGTTVYFNEFGAEEYIEFGELITMKSSQSRFLTEPWIVVDDERAIEYLGLKNLYSKIIPIDELEKFFSLPLDEIQLKIQTLPTGIRKLIAEKAREMIENNTLYDTRVISLLEKELNIELKIIED